MGRIFIAGQPKELPDPGVEVTTFRDPGGRTFYAQMDPFAPMVATDEFGETRELVTTRGAGTLGGGGWDVADEEGRNDPMLALRRVVHAVVLHHDAAASAEACYRVLRERGYSSHFMIDGDGRIWQTVDVADQTIHCAGMNRVSVGIDLNNLAPNLVHEAAPEGGGRGISQQMEINGAQYRSYEYTEAQYRSLVALLEVLCTELQIERTCPLDESGKVLNCVLDTPPKDFRGILGHWHVEPKKWDPGPGFDWERVIAELRREESGIPALPVGLIDQLKDPADKAAFRANPEKAVADALKDEVRARRVCEAVCRACESSSLGGYYPVGLGQTWHGGMHLVVPRGTPIRPLLRGELVAAHLVPSSSFPGAGSEDPPGSNNFVLLRHRIQLPPRSTPAGEEGEKPAAEEGAQGEGQAGGGEGTAAPPNLLTVFSLYMHLDGVDLDRPPEGLTLVERLKGHESSGKSPGVAPRGPTLETLSGCNQVRAMQAGFVGLFSKEGPIVVGPKDVIGFAGEFGEVRGDTRMVHVEVFADDRLFDAMELGLYGRYLQLGPDEPESSDLVVRSWSMLSLFLENERWDGRPRPSVVPTGKVATEDSIREFYAGGAQEVETVRRLIVRHVSEWSDRVEWVRTLLEAQDGAWKERLREPEATWVFREEVLRLLPFVWLTREVAEEIDLKWNDGLVWTFHPLYFLLWWNFRRSAVRGKTLQAILAEVGGRKDLSVTAGVPEVVSDLMNLAGQGEWQI